MRAYKNIMLVCFFTLGALALFSAGSVKKRAWVNRTVAQAQSEQESHFYLNCPNANLTPPPALAGPHNQSLDANVTFQLSSVTPSIYKGAWKPSGQGNANNNQKVKFQYRDDGVEYGVHSGVPVCVYENDVVYSFVTEDLGPFHCEAHGSYTFSCDRT